MKQGPFGESENGNHVQMSPKRDNFSIIAMTEIIARYVS